MVPVSSQTDPGHATCSYSSKIHFNIILPPTYSIPSGLYPSRFPPRILYEKIENGILHESNAHKTKVISFGNKTYSTHVSY
jgi:hypothetical protein